MAAADPEKQDSRGLLATSHKHSFWHSAAIASLALTAALLICLVATSQPHSTTLPHVPVLPWTSLQNYWSQVRTQLPQQPLSNAYPVRFLALGDWGRNGTYNQTLVARQMGLAAEELEAQFVVSTGDNFYDSGLTDPGAEEFSLSFSDVYTSRALDVPWYSVLGNHDYYGNVLAQLSSQLPLRDIRWHCARSMRMSLPLCAGPPPLESKSWRARLRAGQRELRAASREQGGAGVEGCEDVLEVFVIDTTPLVSEYRVKTKRHLDWRGLHWGNWSVQESMQLKELEHWLKSSQATWKVVVGHHPAYSFGHHGDQKEILEKVDPLLRKHGVHVYMNGHDHNLQHIKRPDSPVHYVTNGAGSKAWREFPPQGEAPGLEYFWPGQGFVSVQASPKELKFTFYGIFGDVLHDFVLTH